MRVVFLDSKPLGMVCNPGRNPDARRCERWARDLLAAGVCVIVPEICDYEVRRKLIHVGATAALSRLDRLKVGYDYAPLTTDIMLLAADLWARTRRAGRPTSSPGALDGDCILTATALIVATGGDRVTVATDNVKHFPFVDAQPWDQIRA
jgi:predicted nucleic acid-binding protein